MRANVAVSRFEITRPKSALAQVVAGFVLNALGNIFVLIFHYVRAKHGAAGTYFDEADYWRLLICSGLWVVVSLITSGALAISLYRSQGYQKSIAALFFVLMLLPGLYVVVPLAGQSFESLSNLITGLLPLAVGGVIAFFVAWLFLGFVRRDSPEPPKSTAVIIYIAISLYTVLFFLTLFT